MLARSPAIAAIALLCWTNLAPAVRAAEPPESAPGPGALARLPIREVTVFKDGHAFVLHEGDIQTNASGDMVLDYLPTPVMGTFWPFVAGEGPRALKSVVAARSNVLREDPAISLSELLEANIGASVSITEQENVAYDAVVLAVPNRTALSAAVDDAPPRRPFDDRGPLPTSPPRPAGEPQTGIVLLQRESGVRAVAVDRIRDVTFKNPPHQAIRRTEQRNTLTLRLDQPAPSSDTSVRVGLAYLQKGIRWIPSYRVEIDGQGKANVRLQATLINELADLDDVTVHLVVGVPTFAFKDQVDPISLQETVARLSSHFQPSARTAFAFSNAMTSQVANYAPQAEPATGEPAASALDKGEGIEDLFVFRLEHLTLAKGQCMVVPVKEFTVDYTDVYALEVGFMPPPELQADNANRMQDPELAKLMAAPKVMHKLRLKNSTDAPFTTAPALILSRGQAMAQNLLTYTAPGGQTDLELTAAVDIKVVKNDSETKRVPNAEKRRGTAFDRIHLAGSISLTSFRKQPVEIEVTRRVLGEIDSAEHDGKIVKTNMLEEDAASSGGYPNWWRWYSWPWWWSQLNGIGRVSWKIKLEPGQTIELGYTWHYYWG